MYMTILLAKTSRTTILRATCEIFDPTRTISVNTVREESCWEKTLNTIFLKFVGFYVFLRLLVASYVFTWFCMMVHDFTWYSSTTPANSAGVGNFDCTAPAKQVLGILVAPIQ